MIVCAVILRNKQILLVKHSDEEKPDFGDWLLPAGRVEAGENLEEALRREITEELSLDIKIVRKLIEHVDPYTNDKLADFLCVAEKAEFKVSSELMDAKWFSLKEIRKIQNIHPGLKRFLTAGLDSDWTNLV